MKTPTWCKLLLLFCVTAAFCNGCWDRKDFNQLAIAQAVAVDYEDGQYALTMQLLMPNAIEETVSSDSVWIVSGQGDSVGDALETLAMRAPREIYLAHLDIILLGEGLLQEDVEDGFAFMLKRTALRRRTNLLAVEGKAGDVLQAKAELSDVDIYYLTNLIRDQNRQVNNSEAILNDYYLTVENGLAEGLVIPRVEVENEQSIRLQGAALVADKKLLGWVDQSWLSSYRWITGGKELMTLHDVGSTQSDVTIELSKKKCKWELIAEDPLQVRAKLQAQMVIVENDLQTEQLSLEEIKTLQQEVQAAAEAEIRRQMEAYMAQMQQTGCDTLRLGRWLRAWHPALVTEENWPQLFSTIKIEVQLETNIQLHELK